MKIIVAVCLLSTNNVGNRLKDGDITDEHKWTFPRPRRRQVACA